MARSALSGYSLRFFGGGHTQAAQRPRTLPVYLREAEALLKVLKHGDKKLWEGARETLGNGEENLDETAA